MPLLSTRIDPFLSKPRGVVKIACLIFHDRLWPKGLTLFQRIWLLPVCSPERSPPGKLFGRVLPTAGAWQAEAGSTKAAACSCIANPDTQPASLSQWKIAVKTAFPPPKK